MFARKEHMKTRQPPDNIVCRTCENKDWHEDGYKKAICKIYMLPGHKPIDVLWNGAKCEYYLDETRKDEIDDKQ